jgi:hypothetical protein
MTAPPIQADAAGDLAHVRTAADAAAWLDHRADEQLAEAEVEPSPEHARGLRLAASTLQAIAVVSRTWRDDVDAADGLTQLAHSYPPMTADELQRADRYYQLACGFIAVALTEVSTQLSHAAAPQRSRRASVEASQRPVPRGRDL